MGIHKLVHHGRFTKTRSNVASRPLLSVGRKAKFSDDVRRIMNKWVEMVTKNGIWEHYNPETGRGYGAEGLGMSCLVVDWMARLGIVQVQRTS